MILDVNSAGIDMITKEYANNVVAMAVYHLSAIYVYMKKKDRKKVRKLIDAEIKKYALCTSKLTKRMKVQNRLFIYCPEILTSIFRIRGIKI